MYLCAQILSIMRKIFTLVAAILMTACLCAQSITVSVDNSSTFQPTTIINGSFDTEPWMVFTYQGVTYNTCPDTKSLDTTGDDSETGYAQNVVFNGVGGGWNTTERTIWRSSLFEITNSTDGTHNYQHNSSIPQTNKYVEMNNFHSCMLYQDLRTNSHDVIRWTLKHAVTTAGDDYQPIRVEIGAPNRDSNGNIVNASGWASSLNPQIVPSTKAIYRYDGVTDKDGKTSKIGFGSATDLQYLRLHNTDEDQRSGWWTAQGVYAIPEGQTVTRFGFISEAVKKNQGNLLDAITFSTLIGNLSAQQLANNDVEVKGYWGETEPSKRFKVVIDGTTHSIDMSSVSGKNFRILIPASIIGTATSVEAYHEDYQVAEKSIAVTPVYRSTLQSGTQDASHWTIAPDAAEAGATIDVTYSGSLRPSFVGITPVATTWTMDYTGTIQTFTAPATGVYELQVWGAQGGTYSDYNAGGLGGHATCRANLTEGETIYVYVGGQGGTGTYDGAGTGGWNGGGAGGNAYNSNYPSAAGGGGATHISKVNNQVIGGGSGQCASLVGTNFIIVAGGGGGAGWANTTPGVGGGTEASKGTKVVSSNNYAFYSDTYYYNISQSYGANGGNSVQVSNCDAEGAGGGGGGYYGGNAYCAYSNFPENTTFQNAAGCGGGNEYNSSLASNYSTEAGVRSGNGKAQIRLVSISAAPAPVEATKVGDNHWQYAIPNYNVEMQVEYHPWEGTGTENDPYLISSTADWDLLATKVNGGKNYTGVYFRQTANISINTRVGNYTDNVNSRRPFSGIYDGDGHTLTVTLSGSIYIAPFGFTNSAIIKNLHTAGTISATDKHAAGICGVTYTLTITNCRSSVAISSTVNGDCTSAGFIGRVGTGNGNKDYILIENSVFDGSFNGNGTATNWGGFVAWNYSNHLTIRNCYCTPSSVSEVNSVAENSPICRFYMSNAVPTITNCYYNSVVANNLLGSTYSSQGKRAYSIAGGEGVTVANVGSATTHNVSGLTLYDTGIAYGGVLYAGSGETISLNLSGSVNYKASAGTLSGSTLTMPASDVVIYGAASLTAAPSAKTLYYDGYAQELVTAGAAEGGTLLYKLGEGEWGTSIPTALSVDDYTVTYMVQGDATHADLIPADNSIAVTIHKPTPTITGNADPQHQDTYYSTFYYGLFKYVIPEGVEAYAATIGESDLYLKKIAGAGDVLPEGTAVILKSMVAGYTMLPTDDEAITITEANDLRGVDVPTEVSDLGISGTCYVLSGHSADHTVSGVGFYTYSGTLGAHKAYVVVGNNAPKRMRFVFDTETGVESVQSSEVSVQKIIRDGQIIILRNGVEYNVNGQIIGKE